MRGARDEEIGRGEIAAGAVLAGEVKKVLVGGDGGEEVGGVLEGFQIEELGLDGGVAAWALGRAGGLKRWVAPTAVRAP